MYSDFGITHLEWQSIVSNPYYYAIILTADQNPHLSPGRSREGEKVASLRILVYRQKLAISSFLKAVLVYSSKSRTFEYLDGANVTWLTQFVIGLLIFQSAGKTEPAQPTLDPTLQNLPFLGYTTTDKFGRTITFYLSRPPKDSKGKKTPIVMWIQGSGCQSLFSKLGDRIGGGMQNLLIQEAKAQARILCVEKPGVKFLDKPKRPGSAEEASEEFKREHTLPRWAEANESALRAVWMLPDIDVSKTLVIGHSEGALVAARVASELPQVTHVAPLAGAGPTQLYSLAEHAAHARPGDEPGDAEKRRQAVYDGWAKVLTEPDNTNKFWLGHPYRRWSTFLPYNSTTELLHSHARIYLAHGTGDQSAFIGELDVLRAELLAHGRDVVVERIEGVDHSFRSKDSPPGPPKEMQELFGRILTWFLKS